MDDFPPGGILCSSSLQRDPCTSGWGRYYDGKRFSETHLWGNVNQCLFVVPQINWNQSPGTGSEWKGNEPASHSGLNPGWEEGCGYSGARKPEDLRNGPKRNNGVPPDKHKLLKLKSAIRFLFNQEKSNSGLVNTLRDKENHWCNKWLLILWLCGLEWPAFC